VKSKYSVLQTLGHCCGSSLVCPTPNRILFCFWSHFDMLY